MTVLSSLALLAVLLVPGDGGKIKWTPGTPEEALERAKPSGKPVIAYFRTSNSAFCTQLDALAFSNSDVVKASEAFERVIVDVSDRRVLEQMAAKYAIRGVPTVIFWNGKGELVQTLQGVQTPETMLRAMSQYSKASGPAGGTPPPTGPKVEEWRDTHRVHLRNGNFVDGKLDQAPSDTELVLLFSKGAALKIKLIDVVRIDIIKMRHVNEAVKTVDLPKPGPGDSGEPPAPGPARPAETVTYDENGKPVLNIFVERGIRETLEKLGEDPEGSDEAKLVKDLEQTGEAGRALIAWLLRDARWEMRRASAKALGLLKHAASSKALIALLDPKEEWLVVEQACIALGRIGAVEAVRPLIDMLRSTYKEVVKAAAASLRTLTGVDEAGESYAAWIQWWSDRKE